MAGVRAEAWERVLDCKREFQCLKCDIAMLLTEAENMFTSMSVPLLRLTSLKQAELKEQGRLFSTFYNQEPGIDASIARQSPSGNKTELHSSEECGVPNGGRRKLDDAIVMSPPEGFELEGLKEKAAEFLEKIDKRRRLQLRDLADAVDRLVGSVQSAERHLLTKMVKQEGQLGPLIEKFCLKVRDVDKAVQDCNSRLCSPADELLFFKKTYQTLLALTARLLPNILDVVTANYSSLKVDTKEMVESVRNCISLPLLFVMERLKAQTVFIHVPDLELFVEELKTAAGTSMSAVGQSNQQLLAHIRRLEACCIENQEQIEFMRRQLVILKESSMDAPQTLISSHENEVHELSLCMLEALVEDQARELQENNDINRSLEAVIRDQARELLEKEEAVKSLGAIIQAQAEELLKKEDSSRYADSQLRAERSLKEELERSYLSAAETTSALKADLRELQRTTEKERESCQLMTEQRDAEIERLHVAVSRKESELVQLEMKTSREAAICAKQISHIQSQLAAATVEKQTIENELIQLKQEQSERKRRLRSRASQTVQCAPTTAPENLGAVKISKTFSCLFMPNKKMPFTKLLEEQVHGPR